MSAAVRLNHLVGVITQRDWLTMKTLVARGLFPSAEAAAVFCKRHREDLILGRKGRALLVDARSLDRYLEKAAQP